jgi:hypothetical protein
MVGIATTTGAGLDPVRSLSVDPVVLAIIVNPVVLATIVDPVVLAIIADQLALPVIVATDLWRPVDRTSCR